jgi:hypothetical protein
VPIGPFLENEIGVFDEVLTRAMGVAFEYACAALGLADKSDPVTRLIASKIIKAAKAGERDPDKLYDEVLRWAATAPPTSTVYLYDAPSVSESTGAGRTWRIMLNLGRIKAPDKATAIAEAIKQFNIDDAHRSRLIATPVE